MKFDVIVMQMNGQITDRRRYQVETLRKSGRTRALIDAASSMLRAQLPRDPALGGTFSAAIALSGGYVLHWRQFEPTSALAGIVFEDVPVLFCLMLFGGEPVTDGIAVKATCETMGATESSAQGLIRAFDTIRQRPVVVDIPLASKFRMTEREQKQLCVMTVCFGTAFFEQAAAFIAKVDALCKRLEGTNSVCAEQHLWN